MGSDHKSLRHSIATLAKDNNNLDELTSDLRLALTASYDSSKAERALWEKCRAVDETNILLHNMIEHVEKLQEHLIAVGVELLNNDGEYEFSEEESAVDVPEEDVDVATREDTQASTEFLLTEHPELDREPQDYRRSRRRSRSVTFIKKTVRRLTRSLSRSRRGHGSGDYNGEDTLPVEH